MTIGARWVFRITSSRRVGWLSSTVTSTNSDAGKGRLGVWAYGRVDVGSSLRMDERNWRIPIEQRSKFKVASLPLRYGNTPTRRHEDRANGPKGQEHSTRANQFGFRSS